MAISEPMSSRELIKLAVFKDALHERNSWSNSADVFGHVVDKYLQDEINKLEQKGNVDDHDT